MGQELLHMRLLIFSAVISLILSASLVIGKSLYEIDLTQTNNIKTYIKILMLLPFLSIILSSIISNLPKTATWINKSQKQYMLTPFFNSKKYFFLIWAIIFICWIPVFLASFPGIYGYDSLYDHQLFAHHPIIHTLYLYGTIMLGKILFDNYAYGMAIYSISQMLIMSAIFAYICRYLVKLRTPAIFQILAILFLR